MIHDILYIVGTLTMFVAPLVILYAFCEMTKFPDDEF